MLYKKTVIETFNLTKKYGEFIANDQINLLIYEGRIHAVIGENGAGKTTLMNMLYGMIQPSHGQIFISNEEVKFLNPKDALAKGIGMVHQHFQLVNSLTVYENIFLGIEYTKNGKIDNKREIQEVEELIKEYNFDISATDKIESLSVGQQQRVEILKMLHKKSTILILDEPTAILTPQETEDLLEKLIQFKNMGKTIIIITHKLEEVKKCADEITIIRQGKVIAEVECSQYSEKELAAMMVGKEIILPSIDSSSNVGETVLTVKDVSLQNYKQIKLLDHISFEVRAGEIVGIAGVEGNGQTELIKILSGLILSTSGKIFFRNNDITSLSPEQLRRQYSIGIIPADRYSYGLSKGMSIAENLFADHLYLVENPFWHTIRKKYLKEQAKQLIKKFSIHTTSEENLLSSLSGGNAQKVILARELYESPDLIIAEQPTWGVDIGAIEFIHNQIISLRNQGKAILLVSSELTEIYNLCDRVLVFYKGKIVASDYTKNIDRESIGLYMAGFKREE